MWLVHRPGFFLEKLLAVALVRSGRSFMASRPSPYKQTGGGSRRRRGEGLPFPKGGECATVAKRREDGGNAVPRAHTGVQIQPGLLVGIVRRFYSAGNFEGLGLLRLLRKYLFVSSMPMMKLIRFSGAWCYLLLPQRGTIRGERVARGACPWGDAGRGAPKARAKAEGRRSWRGA